MQHPLIPEDISNVTLITVGAVCMLFAHLIIVLYFYEMRRSRSKERHE